MRNALTFGLTLMGLVGSVYAIERRPPTLAHPECDNDPSLCDPEAKPAGLWIYGTVGRQEEKQPLPDSTPVTCIPSLIQDCPVVEVEEPTEPPYNYPQDEPTPRPSEPAPYDPEPEEGTPEPTNTQLDCNLALSTHGVDNQWLPMADWSYFGTLEIPYEGYQSQYGDNYITDGSSALSPSCADAVVTLMVIRHHFIPLVTDPSYCVLLFTEIVLDTSGEVSTNDGYPVPQIIATQGLCK